MCKSRVPQLPTYLSGAYFFQPVKLLLNSIVSLVFLMYISGCIIFCLKTVITKVFVKMVELVKAVFILSMIT